MSHDTSGQQPRSLGTAGIGLGQLFALIFGFLITSALIFLFGIWVGRDITERRLAREERVVRLPIPDQPTPEAPKPSDVDLAFFETLKQRAEQRLRQTEIARPATPTPTAVAAPVQPAAPTAVPTRRMAAPTPKPTLQPPPARPTPARAPTTATRASNAPGDEWADAGWTVQVATTTEPDQAAAVAERLRRQGYEAYVVRSPMRGQTWYRIRVGRLNDRDAAEALEVRLKREGFDNAYVTPR